MCLPAVSVIIPCYKAAATLPEAVRSVIEQSFHALEILIVDDGSPDESRDVAAALATGDSRIRLISQPNAGPAAARNRGIVQARGDILAFLDADDRWAHHLLATHLEHMSAEPACGVSFARIQFFDPSLTAPGRRSAAIDRLTLAGVLGENPVCTTSNIVARREVFDQVGLFHPGLTHGEDQEWVARVLATTSWQVRGLSDVLVHYRTSLGGLSADLERTRLGWMNMLEHVRLHAPDAVSRAEPEARALFYRYLARRALRTGQPASAVRPMWRAIRASPRALLTRQPLRTGMAALGTLAALLPGNPARRLLER